MKTLIVGIGSPFGDDQVGWLVIDKLEKEFSGSDSISLFKSKGNGTDWFSEINDHQLLIFIDAVMSGKEIGEISEIDINDSTSIPAIPQNTTHSISLADSILMAKNIGMLDIPVRVFGVEAKSGNSLVNISSNVKQSIPELVEKIKASL